MSFSSDFTSSDMIKNRPHIGLLILLSYINLLNYSFSRTNSMAYATFTKVLQFFLSWLASIQFLVLTPVSLSCIVILCSHLRLGLPRRIFPVGLPLKIWKALLPSSILATCPAHSKLLHLIVHTLLGEWYKLFPFSCMSDTISPLRSATFYIVIWICSYSQISSQKYY